MNEESSFTVGPEDAGTRLDLVVTSHLPSISRSLVQRLLQQGDVLVNGETGKPSRRVGPGDRITVRPVLPPSLTAQPENIPLNVLYRDQDLAVVDKPAGMVVHPAAGHPGGTLANALMAAFPEARDVGQRDRPGIVHRLDKDTSGLMVIALTPEAVMSLQKQIASRSAQRLYLALATGRVEPSEATIQAPIGRDASNRKRMALGGVAARPAETSYRVLERLPGFTLLEARLHTGRTHQIRVHLLGIGHPIAGDPTYKGRQIPGLARQFLHAYQLRFRSPSGGQELEFTSPLPADLSQFLGRLRSGSV
jgi:23S rRNA pseudouridine1911/1915/1917 synthase